MKVCCENLFILAACHLIKLFRRQHPTHQTSMDVAILRRLAMQMHDRATAHSDNSLMELAFSQS
jgi:hypothetical protein